MTFPTSFRLFLLAGTALFLFSCQKEDFQSDASIKAGTDGLSKANQAEKFNTFKGPQVRMGNGFVRSFITLSHTGVPKELGIELTKGALSGLPQDPTNFEHATFMVPMHQKTSPGTPFDHVMINWNSHGHEPEIIYGAPHFDFHFYTISEKEQMAIKPGATMEQLPAKALWPKGYVPTEGGVPQMGKHWIDLSSPEFSGKPFTATLIYGSYAGKFIFVEPMITLDFLKRTTWFSAAYGQPEQYRPTNTYYPTRYNIYKGGNKDHYFVTLSGFVKR